MSDSCLNCGGLIMEMGKVYGYAGKVCWCPKSPSNQYQRPASKEQSSGKAFPPAVDSFNESAAIDKANELFGIIGPDGQYKNIFVGAFVRGAKWQNREHSALIAEKDKTIERLREALRKCVLWSECVSMKLENRNEINWTYLNDARDALAGGKE